MDQFFNSQRNATEQYNSPARMTYNADETGCAIVEKPVSIVIEKGIKQIGFITPDNNTITPDNTQLNAINSNGTALSLMLIYLRVNYRKHLISVAPVGSIEAAIRSGGKVCTISKEFYASQWLHC